MAEFLSDIVERISLLWNMLLTLVQSLINAIVVISSGSVTILQLFGYLPFFVATCCTVVVCFGILKFLIGRT